MYKNQLQELAQRSCFNLPSYSCIREGPDHAPYFKAIVNFNGETFESPSFCSTLRQAEHAAAEVALNALALRGPSKALAARVLDETGVYKNLLQETAHRAGLKLPVYTTVRSGPGHVPIFSCTVELAGMSFMGQPARTKKQAQKNAAMAAWSALRKVTQYWSTSFSSTSPALESKGKEEQDRVTIARFLANLRPAESKSVENQQPELRPHVGRVLPARSLYPVQCQGWGYSGFSPEILLYQLWEQEKLLRQHQHQMMMLPFLPSIRPHPQGLLFMHSMLSSENFQYLPAGQLRPDPDEARIAIATSGPPLCLSNQFITDPVCNRSRVTIQELPNEKAQESRDFSPAASSGGESRISVANDGNENQEDYEIRC
ncbi:hypothetical protein CDL15_Pgr000425 [Punica granatum]|uniref:DRBM domain-containing protein n=1 Tax=Punica granatum TaxID=22663 RepID=A0A218W342_PUNGR|nr:hypothetical protein CDL15_Pgr000425 [Punica granatum]